MPQARREDPPTAAVPPPAAGEHALDDQAWMGWVDTSSRRFGPTVPGNPAEPGEPRR